MLKQKQKKFYIRLIQKTYWLKVNIRVYCEKGTYSSGDINKAIFNIWRNKIYFTNKYAMPQ